MTRRPAHGGTSRPPLSRPGSGFGRPLRPAPATGWRGRAGDVAGDLELFLLFVDSGLRPHGAAGAPGSATLEPAERHELA